MTLRLVSSNPDAEPEDRPFELTPRQVRIMSTMAWVYSDDVYDDLELVEDRPITIGDVGTLSILDLYPAPTWGRDTHWRRQAARAFDDLASDLDAGQSPLPRCTGEEMALHLVLRGASALDRDGGTTHIVAGVPAHLRDRDWNAPTQRLFEDHDVLRLFDDHFDPTHPDFLHLQPDQWFAPFDADRRRRADRGFRR